MMPKKGSVQSDDHPVQLLQHSEAGTQQIQRHVHQVCRNVVHCLQCGRGSVLRDHHQAQSCIRSVFRGL